VVAEALTNVAKHSNARSCAIGLRHDAGTLRAWVTDDGSGGAALGKGHDEGHPQLSAAGRASFDPTHDSVFTGLLLGQLLAGLLGALTITSEFSSGMIRATFAAVPRRPPRTPPSVSPACCARS